MNKTKKKITVSEMTVDQLRQEYRSVSQIAKVYNNKTFSKMFLGHISPTEYEKRLQKGARLENLADSIVYELKHRKEADNHGKKK